MQKGVFIYRIDCGEIILVTRPLKDDVVIVLIMLITLLWRVGIKWNYQHFYRLDGKV